MLTYILTLYLFMHNPLAESLDKQYLQMKDPVEMRFKTAKECRAAEQAVYLDTVKFSDGRVAIIVPSCRAVKEYLVNAAPEELRETPSSTVW